MKFSETSLWRRGFGGQYTGIPEAERLSNSLLQMRNLVAVLVGEISADLRQYTVHDVTHLDALWEIASELAGPDYEVTPIETFVLGGAFLLHDAGMTLLAYPQGIPEIEAHPAWPNILQRVSAKRGSATQTERKQAIAEFIRIQHAQRAQELPHIEWQSPKGIRRTLIEDGELRQKFAQSIGQVAASHWWGHEKLLQQLDRIIPAPPPFPVAWNLDLLKVAAIIRVADAAHIDERRAPGFLFATKGAHLDKESNAHWLFQNRLTQPARRGDAIQYSSTSDFQKTEAAAWWLAYDTVRMIDGELRKTDALIADLRGEHVRMAARRVANAENPSALARTIQVSGWMPIDTAIHIRNVPDLITKLGGPALYGQNSIVPLRELLQNGGDAIRLRLAVQSSHDGLLSVVVKDCDNGLYLEVADNGIGMTKEIIQESLLDFGGTGWTNDPIYTEYAAKVSRQVGVIGKFGIGFFSVFMVGKKVDVWTRRFDRAFDETLHLRFENGLDERPLLSPAAQSEWLMEGGTKIRVWLDDQEAFISALTFGRRQELTMQQSFGVNFPSVEFPVSVETLDGKFTLNGREWRTEDPEALIKRVNGLAELPKLVVDFSRNMRTIVDEYNEVIGRICLGHVEQRHITTPFGAVVNKGIAVSTMRGLLGLIEGEVIRAARDAAIPRVTELQFMTWLDEQVRLVAEMNLSGLQQYNCAGIVRSVRGNTESLKICETAEGWLNKSELGGFARAQRTVAVVNDSMMHLAKRDHPNFIIARNIVSVDSSYRPILHRSNQIYERNILSLNFEWLQGISPFTELTLEGLVAEVITNALDLDCTLVKKLITETANDGEYGKYEIPVLIGHSDGVEIWEIGKVFAESLSEQTLTEYAEQARIAHETRKTDDEF